MTWLSCDSVCCMCGKGWSSHWLMTQLTNGQHACVLVFVTVVDILNIPVNLFSVYLMDFMLHTTVDAVGNILRMHYKSMTCDVSFLQGSVSTLFRWSEHAIRVCVKCSSCLQQWKNYTNQMSFCRVMITHVLPRFFGSRPSDHYFCSVCWFVCLCSFSQPSLIRFWSNLDICYISGSSCVP